MGLENYYILSRETNQRVNENPMLHIALIAGFEISACLCTYNDNINITEKDKQRHTDREQYSQHFNSTVHSPATREWQILR